MGTPLGRLEKVDLHAAWGTEAGDFTPWLAQPENLTLLAETIGLPELECEAQEKRVGPFRADILCRDSNGNSVLIENQLERTNHIHLGQILTYAAGLKAVTIVWVSPQFTEEHRAALDWLNDITEEQFSFFGLEIELWRIGDSPPAPKFNVVCKPNDWSRIISDAVNIDGELSETRQLNLEYWQALRAHLEATSAVRMTKPLAQMWMSFRVGRAGFYVSACISRQKRSGWVHFGISRPDHVELFRLLMNDRDAIEAQIGAKLDWLELPEGKSSFIREIFHDIDICDRDDWPRQHEMYRSALEKFIDCFRDRVKSLDISEANEEGV